ncbi:hypothetical protein RN001_005931 [Aquatica leii]|uniref:Regulatory protein zeste n=1 Tax=Aquatica leii TaxID=1421715 RepID=A0AAN7PCG8_9COLE|nr:hypothetical protein RN001_005931 [Aquatica leii]
MDKKRDRATKKQMYLLIKYIEGNPELTYVSSATRADSKQRESKWKVLMDLLNAMDGPKRTIREGRVAVRTGRNLPISAEDFAAAANFTAVDLDKLIPPGTGNGAETVEEENREHLQHISVDVLCPIAGSSGAFADLKTNVRRKARFIQAEQAGTGGGPAGKPLNDLEERVLALINRICIDGATILIEPGIAEENIIDIINYIHKCNLQLKL